MEAAEQGSRDARLRWDAEEDGYTLYPFRLRAELRWRDHAEDGYIELHRPDTGAWGRLREYCEPVLEGLRRGETFPQLARSTAAALPERPAAHVRLIIRKVARTLLRWDMAELVTPPPPERFGRRYDVVGELGRGGMGVLWRCRDGARGGAEVAVKHAWNWSAPFARQERHLRKEAAAMAAFRHPGIVTRFDAFEHDGRFHLVRELVEGPSLRDVAGELTPPERARVVDEVVDVILHMRARGFLFLDVKTDNFMLDGPAGRVKLMDLGVCKALDPAADGEAEAGAARVSVGPGVPGTRSFAAPELIRQRWADERCLVYSLARLHWHLVTGRSPRPRGHYESYFEQHALDQEALEGTDATAGERDLIRRCTDPRPERRPPTLEAFREELR